MNKNKFTVTGTGDSLFLQEFPAEYDAKITEVADFVKSCDVKITNLETNLSDFEYFPGAYSGGTWLNTRRECLPHLMRFGFNCYGTANNHCMDYAFNGLLSTIETLKKAGVAQCGTGDSFDTAVAPAIIEENGFKTAVFAVDTSFETASKAGKATKVLKGRPGVNYLRHDTFFKVSAEELEQLRNIAEKTAINFDHNFSVSSGYATPDPEGSLYFGGKKFTTDQDMPKTVCNKADKDRITAAITGAKKSCDYVFVMVHCHDNDGVKVANPPAYLNEFARACIDAGASAIFGGGCHRLRGIEIYNDCPIFYSLGDFIYQGLRIEHLPADFMEQYSIDIYSTAEEALWARSRGGKVGLHCNKLNYQTVLPKLTFEDGKMTGFELMPLYLNFHRQDKMNGLPEVARDAEAQEILDILNDLSAVYGTTLKIENGMFKLA